MGTEKYSLFFRVIRQFTILGIGNTMLSFEGNSMITFSTVNCVSIW
jgi:hypothetical protein